MIRGLFFAFFGLFIFSGCHDDVSEITSYEVSPLSVSVQCSRSGCSDSSVLVERSGYRYVAPTVLTVEVGNAGNGHATLTMGRTVCEYHGGSRIRRPLRTRNQTQIERGKSYHLHSCTEGNEVELSHGDMITLSVLTWDTTLPIAVNAVVGIK